MLPGGRKKGEEAGEPPGGPVLGRCLWMCPPGELSLRRRQGRLHRLELLPPPPPPGSALLPLPPPWAVKEYSRPAAGKPPPRPEELRPPDVLLATVRHLLALDGQEEQEGGAGGGPPDRASAFLSDRLRAVRLDVSLQRLPEVRPGAAAAVLERALAWLLHAGARRLHAREEDAPLHRGHVQEAFAALRRAYRHRQEEEEEEEGGGPRLAGQPRFQALFLLYNLGSAEVLWETLQLPDDVRTSPELRAALAVNGAFLERNFARFFRLAGALPYLPSCALHPHLANARRLALLTFSYGFSTRNCRYPLARLTRLLAMDDTEEAAELCRTFGLAVADGHVIFQKGAFKDGSPKSRPSHLLVERKQGEATLLDIAEEFCG